MDDTVGEIGSSVNTKAVRRYVSKRDRINRIGDIVNSLDHVSDVRKKQIRAYLIHRRYRFEFPDVLLQPHPTIDEIYNEYSPIAEYERKVDELLSVSPNTSEEKIIIGELCSTYTPKFVDKQSESSMNSESDNDLLEEIDSADFPLSHPPTQERTPAYIQEKLDTLKKIVYDRDDLSDDQKNKLYSLLCMYEERFSLKGENMGVAKGVEHEIITEGRPFRQRLRTYSQAIQHIIDKEVRKLIDEGVIVPSKSPYASNVVLIRKPDATAPGGMKDRVCIDYVELNKQTVKDSYPLPNIQTIFNQISRSTWFTTMDLLNGFWQVMLKPEHRHKTAFLTSRGLYEWLKMPFGLCNAPSTFQRLMDTVILPEYRSFIETYIDDVMTHSASFDEHILHLEKLLQSLTKHNLTVKLSKCKFAQRKVKFLGHIISHKQIKMNPESVEKILEWQRPQSGVNGVKALRGFLGMAGWYRKFIKNFSHIAKPLYELTKKGVKWEWSNACEQAFKTIRDALTKYPVLMAPDPNKDYILETDASDEALSATILQYDDNNELHPIAYASKTLNDAQRNYTVTDREALAIVWGLEHFNTFCEGHKYTAVTDHAALRYLYTAKNKTPRLHRLLLRLQPYDVKLHYRPGEQNHAADLLSRSATYMELKDDKSVRVNQVSTRSRKKNKASHEEWEVQRIVSRRPIKGRADEYEYEVKWKGYDDSDNTWEPLVNLDNAADLVAEFERNLYEQQLTQQPSMESNEDILEEESSVDSLTCDICAVKCTNSTDLYVHRYREHKVSIPTPHYDIEEMDRELLYSLQRHEPQFRVIFDSNLGEKELSHVTSREVKMMSSYEFVLDEDDILYCVEVPGLRTKSKVRTQLRLCLPKQMRRQIMKEIHEGVFAAHPGVVHMYDKMREYVWWPGMLNDIIQYVKTCDVCQRSKGRKQHIPPRSVNIPSGPWTHVGLDWVGPLPITERGNEYILVAKCVYIKYVEAFAAPDISSKTTAQLVIDGVICRYGLPICFTSDRGSSFVSQIAASIYKQLGIKQVKTTSYHPQSNGNVEIFNRQLKATLKMWANERQSDWDLLLPYAVFSYNTAYHSLLQETPFYLQFGRDARLTTDIVLGTRPEYKQDVHEHALELSQNLYDVHTRVRDILKSVNERRDEMNEVESLPQFNIGDEVLLYDPTTQKGLSRKLVQRWKGPYIIIEKHSDVTYAIMKDGRKQVVHVERLRKKNAFDVNYYDDELLVVEDELRLIEESQQRLLARQHQAMKNKDKIQAQIESNEHVDDEGERSEFVYLDVHDSLNIKW
jgi:transposase InsO family protein